jgi:polyhydroxybutyrate depolymerase
MRRWIALTAVALLALAACSGDDSTTDAGGSSSTTTAAETTTSTTAPQAVPSKGCGTATEAATKAKRTMALDGVERYYLETVPARTADDEPMALVVDLHGLAEGAEVHTAMSAFGELGQKEGFAVVFPNGTGKPVRWASNPDNDPNPDLDFVAALLDRVEADLCIDTSRVYASGLSNGAFMTSLVGCKMGDRFAAIAPVAGVQFFDSCAPGRPVPVLAFHGTEDPILLFNGGVNTDALGPVLGNGSSGPTTTSTTVPTDLNGKGYPADVASWAERNGCADPTDEDVTDEVIHRTYDCPEGAAVEFYIVKGGGHTWPGSEFSKSIASVVGYTTFDIDATDLAWKFFQRFRLPPATR